MLVLPSELTFSLKGSRFIGVEKHFYLFLPNDFGFTVLL